MTTPNWLQGYQTNSPGVYGKDAQAGQGVNKFYDASTGRWITPQYGTGQHQGYGDASEFSPGAIESYRAYQNNPEAEAGAWSGYNGQAYDVLDPNSGTKTGSGTFEGLKDSDHWDTVVMIATSLAMGAAAAAAGAGGAAAGAGAEGAAAAGSAGSGIGNGAFLGEAAWAPTVGGGAMPGGFGAAAGAGAAGGGMGNGAFLGEAAWTPTAGGGAMPGGFGGVPPVAGGGGAPPVASGSSGGLLSGLGQYLGPAATLLGGLAGSKGQEQESTSTRDIPEWLKPHVNKVLGYSGGLLDRQMAPGAMAGYDQMGRVGQGLLSQPIAGNGVGKVPYHNLFGR